jgi:hypothetical protein
MSKLGLAEKLPVPMTRDRHERGSRPEACGVPKIRVLPAIAHF